jgi:lipoprotein signal peptidase
MKSPVLTFAYTHARGHAWGTAMSHSAFQYVLCLFCSVIVEVISMVKSEDTRYWNVPVPKFLEDVLETAIKEKV